MNERIVKLFMESVDSNYIPVPVEDHMPSWTEKFAELIIQECANHCDLLLDHKISSEWSRGTHDCSRAIKKHFGIDK